MPEENSQKVIEKNRFYCRERAIILPTYKQMAEPELIPRHIREELTAIGINDTNPLNLFRINWKNSPGPGKNTFGSVNFLEIPRELSGVQARIFLLTGKHFPTGSHKVGATYGPLVEHVLCGKFDLCDQHAVWPSTGNYCRGGVFNSRLLGCRAIAVLPELMSRERFNWLEKMEAEIIATPGGESNVKEIFDRVNSLTRERSGQVVSFNQFCEMGNSRWHYGVTGPAIEEVFHQVKENNSNLRGIFLNQGSAGTLASGEYLRHRFPRLSVAAGEALQCPTLLFNGYGHHRIEGIGDKHVPWILNPRNLDMIAAIDDGDVIQLMRLFNEEKGQRFLKSRGISTETVSMLEHLGLSGIANLIGSIKLAKYYEMKKNDIIISLATDSMELYCSRLEDENKRFGELTINGAGLAFETCLVRIGIDYMQELSYYDKKRIHNLKYFTWIEQQGKDVSELDAQWFQENYWQKQYDQIEEWDERIQEFNQNTELSLP